MKKKRKIDFIINQTEDERLIFRFYPRKSSCHSFNEVPPTKPEEIYKVYYSYAIISQWKLKSDSQWESDVKYYEPCDECSIIDEISERIKYIIEGKTSITVNHRDKEYVIELLNNEVQPFGDGVSWTINDCRKKDLYEIVLWNSEEIGYRFYLEKDKLKEFGKYLNECCEYMLIHGEAI